MLTYADVCRIGALRYVSLEDNGRGESRSVRLVVKVKNERLKMEAELWSRYTLRMHAIRYACIPHTLRMHNACTTVRCTAVYVCHARLYSGGLAYLAYLAGSTSRYLPFISADRAYI